MRPIKIDLTVTVEHPHLYEDYEMSHTVSVSINESMVLRLAQVNLKRQYINPASRARLTRRCNEVRRNNVSSASGSSNTPPPTPELLTPMLSPELLPSTEVLSCTNPGELLNLERLCCASLGEPLDPRILPKFEPDSHLKRPSGPELQPNIPKAAAPNRPTQDRTRQASSQRYLFLLIEFWKFIFLIIWRIYGTLSGYYICYSITKYYELSEQTEKRVIDWIGNVTIAVQIIVTYIEILPLYEKIKETLYMPQEITKKT